MYKDPDKLGIPNIEKQLKLTSKISTKNMWLFNTKGKITCYNTIYDIIEEWYPYRFNLYKVRKEYILNKLKKELNIIKFKVKFILEFINGTIEIRNKTKQSIMEMLEEKEYPKLAIKLNDTNISYDYLLKMDLYKLTKEEIDDLTKKKEIKELEVSELENKTISEIWTEELDELAKQYKKELKKYERKSVNKSPKKIIKKKKKKNKSK